MVRVLQPNVCCVGNPVAGNPTQFVMHRAARAAGLDWRFFTAQVAKGQFEIAFRGIQALGLDGLAVFAPFQEEAVQLLESVTESALLMGKVNVARSDNQSWLGDNTLGSAIASCIEANCASVQQLVLPNESSCRSVLVHGSDTMMSILRLADPKLELKQLEPMKQPEPIPQSETSKEPSDEPKFQDRFQFLLFERAPSASTIKLLSSVDMAATTRCLVLESSSEKQMRPFVTFLSERQIRMVDPVELLAFQAAADFAFWTGAVPSVELLRDSLEEYLQW
jgi:shikimate dehydrogenase